MFAGHRINLGLTKTAQECANKLIKNYPTTLLSWYASCSSLNNPKSFKKPYNSFPSGKCSVEYPSECAVGTGWQHKSLTGKIMNQCYAFTATRQSGSGNGVSSYEYGFIRSATANERKWKEQLCILEG